VAVVGLVDAELGLHCEARQADLAAHDTVAAGQAQLEIGQLDGIGVGHGQLPEPAGDGRDRSTLLLGRPQLLGHGLNHLGLGHAPPQARRTSARYSGGRNPRW
jgi:hypothetical protein